MARKRAKGGARRDSASVSFELLVRSRSVLCGRVSGVHTLPSLLSTAQRPLSNMQLARVAVLRA